MERERWLRLYHLAAETSRRWLYGVRFNTACIVGVYLWAVVHDRPVSWACQRKNWSGDCRFRRLPSQSTMSRRMQSRPVQQLLNLMEVAMKEVSQPGLPSAGIPIVETVAEPLPPRVIDAKPLPIGSYSKDPDSRCGRAAGGFGRGYKFYAIWGQAAVPDAWEVRSMNIHEVRMAEVMIPRLRGSRRLLGDAIYDSSELFDFAFARGQELIAPPRRKAKSNREYPQSSLRKKAHAYLANGGWQTFHKERVQIERNFGNWTSFSGGLAPLPSWVRRLPRVLRWIQAKLIINADRILQRRQIATA